MLQLVGLDIWNTILKSNPDFKKQQIVLFADFFQQDKERFTGLLQNIDLITDRLSTQTGKDLNFEYRLQKIAKKLKVPINQVDLQGLYQKMENNFIDNPPFLIEENLIEMLQKIKSSHLQLALLSNTGFVKGLTMRKVLDDLGLLKHIDFTVFSDEVGFAKPHPKIFQTLINQSQLFPQQILHLGDNFKADYCGAKNIGMQALLFEKNNELTPAFVKTNDKNNTHKINSIQSIFHFL
jgi:putative hydrolase of the HAD superfamily